MSDLEDLLEVGTVTKAHGTAGEVVVRLITNQTERLDSGSSLMSDLGELVVSKSRQHHDKWLVQFHGVENRTQAEELRGLTLRAEPLDIPDALWVHELIGSVVIEVSDGGELKSVAASDGASSVGAGGSMVATRVESTTNSSVNDVTLATLSLIHI